MNGCILGSVQVEDRRIDDRGEKRSTVAAADHGKLVVRVEDW